MQPDTTGWAPAGGGPQHRQPAPTRGVLFTATGRSKAWLCSLLILAGLSGSAAQTVLPLPLASSDPGTTASESVPPKPVALEADVPVAAPAPESAAGAPADLPAPDAAAAPPAEAPPAEASPADADLLDVTPVLGTKQRSGPPGDPGSWNLVFDENFDVLNKKVWTPYWFNDCSPKSMMNNVKTCSKNIRVANGEAVLQLSDAESGALLSTNPKDGVRGHVGFTFTSGYAEARIAFPGNCRTGIPNWPAWWTVGQKFPHTGEIDIAEGLAGEVWSVYHSAAWSKSQKLSACRAGTYHTYGVHRKDGANDVYYDGRLVHSYVTSDGNSPHYLLLNVGAAAGLQAFGEASSVKVDYVRVWQ